MGRIVHCLKAAPLALAAACLLLPAGAEAKIPKELKEKALKVIDQGTRSGDIPARAMAVEALGHFPKKQAKPGIKMALEDKQWQVRRAVIAAMLKLKDKAWQTEIRKAMRSHAQDPATQVMPLLEPLGQKNALKYLLKVLSEPDFPKPERYVQALVLKGGDWMVEGFIQGLKVRSAATKAAFQDELSKLPLPQAVDVYKVVLAKQPPEVQAKVLDHVMGNDKIKDWSFLKKLTKSKDPVVAFRVAATLAHRGDDTGRKLLMDAVHEDSSASQEDKLKALEAIRHIPPTTKAMQEDLYLTLRQWTRAKDVNMDFLRAAVEIHAALKNPKLGPWLDRQVNSDVPERRAVAVAALGAVQGKKSLPRLYGLLNDGDVKIRRGAARAIGELAQRESLEQIRMALGRENDTQTKVLLINALGKIRVPEIVNILRFEADSRVDEVKIASVKAIAAVHHQDTIVDLKPRLWDRVEEVRSIALFAILRLGPKRYLEHFKTAMDHVTQDQLIELTREHKGAVLEHIRLSLAHKRDALRIAGLAASKLLDKADRITVYKELALKAGRVDMRLEGLERLVPLLSAKDAIEFCSALVNDAKLPIKVRAIQMLGQLKAKTSVEALTKAMDDLNQKERVRIAAAAALLQL